jgi:hypothetical protein
MSKQSRKEGNKVACLIKKNKAEYYISDVDISSRNDLVSTMTNINKTLGKFKSSYIIIGNNKTQIFVLACSQNDIPFTIEEWVKASTLGTDGEIEITDNYCVFTGTADFPFKLKDTIKGNGFAFLNKHGCMEESESEEFIGFDDI